MSEQTNIVMLVHGRPTLTRQALRTLARNTDHESYNLTLVVDGPDHGLPQLVANMNHSIVWVTPAVNITGRLRNLGVYWSEKHFGRGDWLYLSDNDVYFRPRWLDTLVQAWSQVDCYKIQMLGGWNHPFLQPKTQHPIQFKAHVATHDAVAGASQLMRWSTWDAYGPLDAHAKGVGQSEDWAFCQKIIQDGGRVGSIYPRVVFNCGLTNSFGQPSPGADQMRQELVEAKRVYPNLEWE